MRVFSYFYLLTSFLSLCFKPNHVWGQSPLLLPVIQIGELGGEVGTGFLVGDKEERLYFLTAWHVVEEYGDSIPLSFRSHKQETGKIEASHQELDVAVVSCPKPEGYTTPPLYERSEITPSPASTVITIGHPYQKEWDVNYESSIKSQQIDFNPGRFTIATSGVKPGCSGGPIFNQEEELIGMMQSLSHTEVTAISARTLYEMLETWSVPTTIYSSAQSVHADLPTVIDLADYDLPSYKLLLIYRATFKMGQTDPNINGENRSSNEQPVHSVKLDAYMIGETEVTQELWEAVMGYNPSKHKAPTLPVESISWQECRDFVLELNRKTQLNLRLPTEAEWEYAASAGESRTYAGVDSKGKVHLYGNFYQANNKDGFEHTAPVASFLSNGFGLYDMSGNVWEWCQDRYGSKFYAISHSQGIVVNPQGPEHGNIRVIRGGGWGSKVEQLRVKARGSNKPTAKDAYTGFRLAKTP